MIKSTVAEAQMARQREAEREARRERERQKRLEKLRKEDPKAYQRLREQELMHNQIAQLQRHRAFYY